MSMFFLAFLDCYRKQVAHQRLLDGNEAARARTQANADRRTARQKPLTSRQTVRAIRAKNRNSGNCVTSE